MELLCLSGEEITMNFLRAIQHQRLCWKKCRRTLSKRASLNSNFHCFIMRAKTRQSEPKSELTLSLAFHRCLPPGWVVTYSRPIDDVLDFLATSNRDDGRLTRRTWCGDISDFRRQCIHNDPDILKRTISWFLEHYGPCPDFAWIPYEQAILDPDDS